VVTQEQRKRQLAREKFLRQQQRRTAARRKARVRNSVIASVLGVILVGSLALYTSGVMKDDDKAGASAETTPSAAPTSKAPDPCDKPAAGKVETQTWKKEPALSIDKSAKYTLDLATTCGKIDIALKASAAPHTVNSFDFLANKGFFDHTKCHRLTTNGIYVLQCGDPTGSGSGGPTYKFAQEVPQGTTYPRGTIAMANTGQPNSTGSQFFLCFTDTQLSPDYSPVGTVDAAGLAVLDKIAAAGNNGSFEAQAGGGAPNTPVTITSMTVKS
jgi:peptidyl-prolyl cis-trans isomerase B (cyclophilin B)